MLRPGSRGDFIVTDQSIKNMFGEEKHIVIRPGLVVKRIVETWGEKQFLDWLLKARKAGYIPRVERSRVVVYTVTSEALNNVPISVGTYVKWDKETVENGNTIEVYEVERKCTVYVYPTGRREEKCGEPQRRLVERIRRIHHPLGVIEVNENKYGRRILVKPRKWIVYTANEVATMVEKWLEQARRMGYPVNVARSAVRLLLYQRGLRGIANGWALPPAWLPPEELVEAAKQAAQGARVTAKAKYDVEVEYDLYAKSISEIEERVGKKLTRDQKRVARLLFLPA